MARIVVDAQISLIALSTRDTLLKFKRITASKTLSIEGNRMAKPPEQQIEEALETFAEEHE